LSSSRARQMANVGMPFMAGIGSSTPTRDD
jgi:hypothetical protein